MPKKDSPRFTGQVLVRAWVEVPLRAKTAEEARIETDQLKLADVATFDGEVLDYNVDFVGIHAGHMMDKLDS